MKLARVLAQSFAGILLLAGAFGCGNEKLLSLTLAADEHELLQLFDDAWQRIQVAPYATRYQGERRIEFRMPGENGALVPVAYLERVSSDGLGHFQIEPLQAETPVYPDPATFLLLQQGREGFFFRYRDFAVRDPAALIENFDLLEGVKSVVVAGRDCMQAQLVRRSAGGHHYEVAFDLATGLPLRYIEFDDAAQAVSKMEFVSIDFAPDLSQVAFHVPRNAEVALELGTAGAAELLGFEPRLPGFVPPGFRVREVAKVEDDLGRRWLKLGYTDGVEMLFFLCRKVETPSLPATRRLNGAVEASEPMDEILLFEAAPMTVAQGVVKDHAFIAIGEVASAHLLRMIDSAVE